MKLDDLDHRQREVVDTVVTSDDRIIVLGGAGTGKTTTALWTARTYLETSAETPAPRVLFLTFSRPAVSQITSRSPGVLSGYSDRVEILTFHGLSYWLLRTFGRYAGYGTAPILVQSNSRTKLRGHDGNRLEYDDLIEGVSRVNYICRFLLSHREMLPKISTWGHPSPVPFPVFHRDPAALLRTRRR